MSSRDQWETFESLIKVAKIKEILICNLTNRWLITSHMDYWNDKNILITMIRINWNHDFFLDLINYTQNGKKRNQNKRNLIN